jgi:hypothetical protein
MGANPITLDSWTAHADDFYAEQVRSDQPLQYRLFWLACQRANVIGHAEFPSKQLAPLLATAGPHGEAVIPTGPSVSRAIATAKALGLLDATSSARCLVLPPHGVQRGGAGSKSCAHHGIGRTSLHGPRRTRN